ncbi:MAG: hypothetical protein QCI00_08750 [Candidatus Thermoplasmatota archaeon]|nr:hypothetical protein [Candidatus Thermoplasmatota archaeon]
MSEGLELNTIIQDTIFKNCENEETLDFIVECLQYELDIWNRQILHTEVMQKYELILEKMIRG